MQEYVCRSVICENRSVRYLIKLHSIKWHTLRAILFLIIILLFEEIKVGIYSVHF